MFYNIICQLEELGEYDVENDLENINNNHDANIFNPDENLDEILKNESSYNFVKERDSRLVEYINKYSELNNFDNLNNEIMKKLNVELTNNQYNHDKSYNNLTCSFENCNNVFSISEICLNCNKIYCSKCIFKCLNCNTFVCKDCGLSFSMTSGNIYYENKSYNCEIDNSNQFNINSNFYNKSESNYIQEIEKCQLCSN